MWDVIPYIYIDIINKKTAHSVKILIACGSLDYARKVAQTADYTHYLQALNMYVCFPALILKVIDLLVPVSVGLLWK